jgi:hypothetical protein
VLIELKGNAWWKTHKGPLGPKIGRDASDSMSEVIESEGTAKNWIICSRYESWSVGVLGLRYLLHFAIEHPGQTHQHF